MMERVPREATVRDAELHFRGRGGHRMGMAATQTHWTVDMVQALPDDGQRHEIMDGELFVTPAPSADHQEAAFRLARYLYAYLAAHRVGHVFTAPGDVEFDRHTLVQPDLFVVPLVQGKRPRTWKEAGRPLLAVEVLSPSTARVDRVRKRELYQRQGVPEYWIVDLDARVIERWRPDDQRPEILSDRITWKPENATEPMTIELAEYWHEVFDG
ncbi:MAG TPA: Uma2 family endonuclease [Gemmatimonadaceae bacterium]